MNRRKTFFGVLAVGLLLSGCATHDRDGLFYVAPSLLPDTTRPMKTPGFWIARHPAPDKPILSPDGIEFLNRVNHERKLIKDIFDESNQPSVDALNDRLMSSADEVSRAGYYLIDGNRPASDFFEAIKSNVGRVVEREDVLYGMVVRYAHQRILPTEEVLTAKRLDIDFDELQNSGLDIGTPVRIAHESVDGQWFYVEGELSDGWVKKENVAVGPKDAIQQFLKAKRKGVVVVSKADIYMDEDLREFYDYIRMGVELPIIQAHDDRKFSVQIPYRADDGVLSFRTVFMEKGNLHEGYLPFTPRYLIGQAFLMLNEPYGWGGMYGEQDCSRFLQMIFKTMGVSLPRNSSAQAKAGEVSLNFPEGMELSVKAQMIVDHALPGVSVLAMRGHIMLYLGYVDGKIYAIHAPWAYRENDNGVDRIRVINRVAVTSLDLGKGSQKGSLLERVNGIVNISK